MTVSFLPVRIFFYTYVTHNWLGNLGMLSIIALTMFALVQKNKLGVFGVYFKNRIRRFVFNKTFYLIMFTPLFGLGLFGSMLWFIDMGEFQFQEERNLIAASIVYSTVIHNYTNTNFLPEEITFKNIELPKTTLTDTITPLKDSTMIGLMIEHDLYPTPEAMIKVGNIGPICNDENTKYNETLCEEFWKTIYKEDYFLDMLMVFSHTAFVSNQVSGAWASHVLTVWMIGDLEFVGITFLYRKIYFNKAGYSWNNELQMFPKKHFRRNLRKQTLKLKTQNKKGLDWFLAKLNYFFNIV